MPLGPMPLRVWDIGPVGSGSRLRYNRGMLRILLACLLALQALPVTAGGHAEVTAVAQSGKHAATAGTLPDAHEFAGRGFDSSATRTVYSPPLVRIPEGERQHPQADLIVGRPGRFSLRGEPETPLTDKDTAKEQGSGKWLWWTLGGAAAGAGLGFLLGGPIGAGIGAVLGGLLGFFLRG
jgi:hypothetical protein